MELFATPVALAGYSPAFHCNLFFFLSVLRLENNIYAQIAMVMLIGILGKNAVLIVEFAVQRHAAGATVFQSAVEGAAARLRPILMTSFAFIAGLIPLVMAAGPGAIGNRTIGSAAAGGMLFGTVFGVIIIPGLYYIFAKISEKNVLVEGEKEETLSEMYRKYLTKIFKKNKIKE